MDRRPAHRAVGLLYLYACGAECMLPVEAEPFVVRLADVPRFRARACLHWDRRLAWPAAAELLDGLLRAGVLRRVSHG